MRTPIRFRRQSRRFFIPALVLFGLAGAGCEGYRCAEGTVRDGTTNKPVDGVYVTVLTGTMTMQTDSTGRFNVCNQMSGCVPDCKDITVEFSKRGYKTQTVTNPDDSKDYVVLLEQN